MQDAVFRLVPRLTERKRVAHHRVCRSQRAASSTSGLACPGIGTFEAIALRKDDVERDPATPRSRRRVTRRATRRLRPLADRRQAGRRCRRWPSGWVSPVSGRSRRAVVDVAIDWVNRDGVRIARAAVTGAGPPHTARSAVGRRHASSRAFPERLGRRDARDALPYPLFWVRDEDAVKDAWLANRDSCLTHRRHLVLRMHPPGRRDSRTQTPTPKPHIWQEKSLSVVLSEVLTGQSSLWRRP
jgi:hypothetical protein